MYCVKCGQQLPDDASFCSKCGLPQRAGVTMPSAESPIVTIPIKDQREVQIGKGQVIYKEAKSGLILQRMELNSISSFKTETLFGADVSTYSHQGVRMYLSCRRDDASRIVKALNEALSGT